MRTLVAIAFCLATIAMPATAQTSTTNCRNSFNGFVCDTTTPQQWTMPDIQQIDVAGALRMADRIPQRRQTQIEQQTYFGEDPAAEFLRFREQHPWYDLGGLAGATQDEKRARALADLTAEKFAAQGLQKEIPPSEFFARVGSEVMRQIPSLR